MTETTPDDNFLDLVQDIIDLLRARETEDALSLIQKGIAEYPNQAELYLLTSVCCYHQNDIGRAIELCETAHKLSPDCQEVVDSLAVLHIVGGNLNEGLYYAKLATTLEPHPDIIDLLPLEFSDFFAALKNATPSRHYLDGMYRYNFQVFDEAADEFQKELRRNPDHLEALKKLGQTYVKLNRPADALKVLDAYRARVEDDAEAIAFCAMAHCLLAAFDEAAQSCAAALATDPDSLAVALLVLEASVYFGDADYDKHLEFVAELNRRIAGVLDEEPGAPQMPPAPDERPLNVAVVSNQLLEGEVATYLLPYLRHADRKRFNVTVYQQSAAGGAVFSALKSTAPDWRRIVDVDDDVVELIMSREKVDIVLDLCGFSEFARPSLCAMLGDRITTNMFCLPHGDGAPGTNLFLSDSATAAADEARLTDGQINVVCERGLFAIDEPQVMGDVNDLPAAKNGHLTFGGTATLSHLSEHTVSLWADVLNAHPDSRLYLGYIENASAEVKERARELFAAHGLDGRVSVWNTDYDHRANPSYFGEIDIYLDTTPVNGTLALCHALWMGVPVVTRRGTRRSAVMGASILHSAGKPEWVADSDEDFVAVTQALSGDTDALAATRAALRDEVKSSKLLDTRGYVRGLEKAFIDAVEARRSAG